VVAPQITVFHLSAGTCLGKVLLVDPDVTAQTPLVSTLSHQGYEVYITGNAADVWMLIRKVRLDVILLETRLTDLSGFELCHQLKQSPQAYRIPVLFLGDGSQKRDRLRAFEVGGVDFIPKPYWEEEVIARVALHISLGQVHQRVEHHTRRVMADRGHMPLLTNLQQALHKQALKLQEKNTQLEREVQEREQVEKALRHEQQKSEQLLLNILPGAIVDQLKHFQGSLAERFEAATVLFADIVNFTPLAAEISPLELVNLLNQIFSAFDRLVAKYQLEKIKTIGDAYMAVGGVPTPLENHAAAVADMALEMQTVIQGFKRQGAAPLQLRIGINTGTVVAGVIGIRKFSYDLWGDAVNVANRMEAQGIPGKIQVTEATYQHLRETFLFEPGQDLDVKGKGRMATYYLLGRR